MNFVTRSASQTPTQSSVPSIVTSAIVLTRHLLKAQAQVAIWPVLGIPRRRVEEVMHSQSIPRTRACTRLYHLMRVSPMLQRVVTQTFIRRHEQ